LLPTLPSVCFGRIGPKDAMAALGLAQGEISAVGIGPIGKGCGSMCWTLGQSGEAQDARWAIFEHSLDADYLRAI
jgi:hypothetical protein